MKLIWARVEKLRNSTYAKNAILLALGTSSAQIISMATMPILSRLYSPEVFGSLAFFMAVFGITSVFSTLRYETTILLPKNDNDAKTLVAVASIATLTTTTLILIILSLINSIVKLRLEISFPLILTAVIFGGFSGLISVGNTWLNRLQRYNKLTLQRLAQSVTAAAIGVIFGYYGSEWGLLIAQCTVIILTCAFFSRFLLRSLSLQTPKLLATAAKTHLNTPKFLLPTSLLDVVTMHLPIVILITYYGSEVTGQFSMAWKMAALPISLVGAAVGQVFFQRYASVWPDRSSAAIVLYQTWGGLTLVGLIPTVLLLFWGQDIFAIVLGENWSEAGHMATYLAPMLLAMLISSPTSSALIVMGLQRYSLYFGIAVFLYRPLCLYLGWILNDIYKGLALLTTLEILQISIYQYIIFRHLRS
ncbi:oligosaccharide flippase family protein [Pseudomonas sp. Os17]|uniref:oligosaccharide flippase family protein n=1 Tax=Pseudomonas sp. Os17 TaxID=1500686 RepID=UPI0009E9C2CA|nr:oligosaccharide flippase family protein [Pseudomonas sp. Os17]